MKHAVSLGVNHFDCARCYGDSLRKLGLALREISRQDVIVTGRLCCHSSSRGAATGDGEPDFSAQRVVRDVEDQLAILGIDHFDGMLIHDPPRMEPALAKEGTLAGLLSLKARGVVRNVGFGMRPHEFHRQAIATGGRRLPAVLQRLPSVAAERRRRGASGGGRCRRGRP